MSANPPADGMFFVDQPQPAEPVAAPVPAPAPAAPAAEAPFSAPQQAPADVTSGGMRDVPLGTLIFRAGLLAEEQVEDALQEGMRTGKRLGEVLLERGWLHERDLGRLLAGQKALPFIELGAVSPDPAAVRLLPEEKARFQTALPIGFEDGVPVVAVADPSNNLVIENLRRALNTEPRLVVAAYSELARKIEHAYAAVPPPVPQLAPNPEPQIAAAPVAEARASVAAPTPAAEPVAEQPPAPAVTPMQAVLPPVETRRPEPVQQVAPPVAEQPAPVVPEVPPPPVQPLAEQPAPVVPEVSPPLVPSLAEQAPQVVPEVSPPLVQPLVEQPVAQQPVVEPAVAEQPFAPQPEVLEPQAAAAQAFEPLTAPAQPEPEVTLAPIAAPPAEETPTHVPEFSQLPVAEPVLEEATAEPSVDAFVADSPTHVEPAEPSADGSPADSSTHFVVLRLSEGEHLEVGTFGSGHEAQDFAREVVRQIAATEGESAWPFFAGRFLRPETIVSVDVIAESQERWMGSQIRSRWAAE